MKKIVQIFILILMFSTFLYANNKQKILILHSYNQSYAWTHNVHEGIISVLKERYKTIDIFVEYMDTKRFVNKNHYNNLLKTYENKYKNIKFDVIISSDNNALNFLKKYNKTVFKSAPVVFCGINFLKEEDIKGYENFTGIGEDIDIIKSYEIVKQLHPNLENIYSIIDTTTTGQRIKKEVVEYTDKLPKEGINYETIDNVTFAELKQKVQNLPKNSAILHHMFFRSKDNNFYDYHESTQMISDHSKAPLYTTADMYLRHGSIGGYLNSGLFQGKEASLMATDILNGKKIQDIPVKYKSPNKYMFDYEKIIKYNINSKLLPKESYIINKPKNFYGIYKNEIRIVAILFLLMFVLIFILLKNIQKRKNAEKEIVILNKNLEEKVEIRTQELVKSNDELEQSITNLKNTQNKLIESEKMAGLGGLVAGVAHEINTPVGVGLTGITYFKDITENIKNSYETDNMSQDDFENYLKTSNELATVIHTNLERTAHLVRSFKQISVDQISEEKREFLVKNYIEEILISISNITKKTNLIIKVECDDKIKINSYPGALSQIFTNLIINSINHGYEEKEEGILSIVIEKSESSLKIIYKDDGKGIPSENLPKVFNPFFTTGRSKGGTGLGLNIVYNLVTSQLNGSISCKSKESFGVEFIITLDEQIIDKKRQ